MKNKIRAVVSSARNRRDGPDSSKRREISDKEAFDIAQNVGGGEGGEVFGDLADVAPLVAEVSGIAGPKVALAIAAAKIAAEEIARRQKEAGAIMKENKGRAEKARDEAIGLIDNLELGGNKEKEELTRQLTELKEKVKASSQFSDVGQNFQDPQALYQNLMDNGMVLPSSNGGIIESYKSNEDLVAAVSGGKALHGIALLLDDYPILESTMPVLKRPEYVQMFGVTQPFVTSMFKSNKQTEMDTCKYGIYLLLLILSLISHPSLVYSMFLPQSIKLPPVEV
jgi:hypothetical protein